MLDTKCVDFVQNLIWIEQFDFLLANIPQQKIMHQRAQKLFELLHACSIDLYE